MGSSLIWASLFGLGTVHDFFLSPRGRPGGRNVDSRPRRFAVACCQTVSPNGVPPCVLRHNAFGLASDRRTAAASRPAHAPLRAPVQRPRSRPPSRSWCSAPRRDSTRDRHRLRSLLVLASAWWLENERPGPALQQYFSSSLDCCLRSCAFCGSLARGAAFTPRGDVPAGARRAEFV